MNGAEKFTFSIKEVPPLLEEALSAANWLKEEVYYFILHQANKFMIENIARKLKVPFENTPHNVFEKDGNQSFASIPVCICENLFAAIWDKSAKVVLAGYGFGLSWAACAFLLGPIQCRPATVLGG